MTIKFYCPNCDALIAFDSKHCGKRGRCLSCGQVFIIPSKDDEPARKIEPKIEKGEPSAGFYRAVFIDSWKLFIDPENVTSLAFVIAVVCFKFFLARAICCINYISYIIIWGWLFGFYLNIIYETSFEIDKLPEVYLGTSINFLWYVIKPFFTFVFTLFVVLIPFFIALSQVRNKGITLENLWDAHSGFHLLVQMLFIFGLFLFPMAILTAAVGRSPSLFRPDYLLSPIFRAPWAYLSVVALLVATCVLEMQTKQFDGMTAETFFSTAGKLLQNLAIQIAAIIAMRSTGLFYRHYNCYFR